MLSGDDRQALLLVSAGAVTISFSPVFVKAIGPDVLGPSTIAFWRQALGTLALCAIALLTGRSLRLPPRALAIAALAGVFFAADLYCWHRSILLTGAGMATILGNTQVFASALLSYLIWRETLTLRFFLAAFGGLISVALLVGLFSDSITFTRDYLLGIAFGLGTGLAYAAYIVTVKQAGRQQERPDLVVFMAYASGATALILFPLSILEPTPVLPSDAFSWLMLLGLGVLVQAFGWWAIATSLPRIETHRASLLLLLQPALATVWGWLLFNEALDLLQVLGAAGTLVAIYIGSVRHEKRAVVNDSPS